MTAVHVGPHRQDLLGVTDEELQLRLGGEDWADVRRVPGADTVEVVRYWAPEPGRNAKGDDDWSQWAGIRAASRTTNEPVDVAAIVAAVLRGKENG